MWLPLLVKGGKAVRCSPLSMAPLRFPNSLSHETLHFILDMSNAGQFCAIGFRALYVCGCVIITTTTTPLLTPL